MFDIEHNHIDSGFIPAIPLPDQGPIVKAIPSALPPSANGLLAALPAADYARIAPHLQSIPLPLGWSLYESGAQMRDVSLPTAGIASLLSVTENGPTTDIALIGNGGLVGISLFMGGDTTPSRAIVLSAGQAYR